MIITFYSLQMPLHLVLQLSNTVSSLMGRQNFWTHFPWHLLNCFLCFTASSTCTSTTSSSSSLLVSPSTSTFLQTMGPGLLHIGNITLGSVEVVSNLVSYFKFTVLKKMTRLVINVWEVVPSQITSKSLYK